ncbi:cytoplasmic protein [Coprinopsis marcescibilis]|uniref:Cytoplasmic protein n=1 Tax=Coprinopsis marcescibilis TaxID=230819 RepID=A0A5C3KSS0_COPMA|nr:cytoplasmic protein [Coprinopsis marcescibilis]
MASYLRSWLWTGTTPATSADTVDRPEPPTIQTISPQASDDEDGSATETEQDQEDDDVAPAFPSLNSAQRLQSGPPATSTKGPTPARAFLSDSALMPPPPVPSLAVRTPGVQRKVGTASLFVPPTNPGANSLAVPPSTTKAPPKPSKKREKVALAPGHSAMDWANLKASGADLRGVDTLLRIPPSVLKQHNKRDDAWSAFYGKVYNITPYIPFHPGGEKDLMRVAGRDGTKLFATTHGWVNADFMLDACLVGFLVPEPS